jgi:Polyprenyl synthetase
MQVVQFALIQYARNHCKIIRRKFKLKFVILQATSVYTQQLLELHRGQGMEIYWRDNYACPTEEEYRDMTKRSAYKSRVICHFINSVV